MVWRIALWTVAILAIGTAAVRFAGARRWRAETRSLRDALEAARAPFPHTRVQFSELDSLPPPVQRYLRKALQPDQPLVAAAYISHTGTFNLSATAEQWRPFTSDQMVITNRPGFNWDARVRMAPGVTAFVHDAYVAGEGVLHGSAFGLISIVNQRGTPEFAVGELMRYLAETAWYPTALLPGMGVQWSPVDDSAARATLTDRATTVSLLFRFGADSLIESVFAEARGRTVGKEIVPTPWEGRWSRYDRRDGMMVPLYGDVAWVLPEGRWSYWRGEVKAIRYEWAR